jgi:hypothetical protein
MSQDVLMRGTCADDATCAICDRPVVGYSGEPARRGPAAPSTVLADSAWCLLDPCGHTFIVRRGGLIH